jgi:signal transduction histidine kinase
LRHTPAGGTIDVQAQLQDSRLLLSVTDSGTGIGTEHLEHVFDRFYKVDPARVAGTNGAAGSGLGLSIVKAIVERHGGTIGVTSVPGRTEFRISLPQSSTNL